MPFDPAAAARFIAKAHADRRAYANLPPDLAPPTLADAYAAQEALVPLWSPVHGPIAGLKIATTTRIMQQLMGIDHPCGGIIYGRRVHATGAAIARSAFLNLVIECELAVRLARDLPARAAPYTREAVHAAIGAVMPAFELIEDRNAVYRETRALSLIADNAWNGGIVLGAEHRPVPPLAGFDGLAGGLEINGRAEKSGRTDDPLGALAWVANLAVERGRPMTAGMVVITGSVIPTLPIGVGDRFRFSLDGIGTVEMSAAA
jgi:2-keto-4-pentenoate hydratase